MPCRNPSKWNSLAARSLADVVKDIEQGSLSKCLNAFFSLTELCYKEAVDVLRAGNMKYYNGRTGSYESIHFVQILGQVLKLQCQDSADCWRQLCLMGDGVKRHDLDHAGAIKLRNQIQKFTRHPAYHLDDLESSLLPLPSISLTACWSWNRMENADRVCSCRRKPHCSRAWPSKVKAGQIIILHQTYPMRGPRYGRLALWTPSSIVLVYCNLTVGRMMFWPLAFQGDSNPSSTTWTFFASLQVGQHAWHSCFDEAGDGWMVGGGWRIFRVPDWFQTCFKLFSFGPTHFLFHRCFYANCGRYTVYRWSTGQHLDSMFNTYIFI